MENLQKREIVILLALILFLLIGWSIKAAACTHVLPTVLIPSSPQSGTAGSLKTYTVNVTNLDTADCAPCDFALSVVTSTCPTGWTCSLASTTLAAVAPGATASTTLTITSASGASVGAYNINVITMNACLFPSTITKTAVYNVVTITPPTTTNQAATSRTTSSAVLNGTITAINGQNADQRGFDIGTSPGTYNLTGYIQGTVGSYVYGTGAFSWTKSGLTSNTTYYFRAKAHNSAGWYYATPELSFKTLAIYLLTVNKSGTGSGTVTSNEVPPLINCGTDCTENYTAGTSVTLTAVAAAGSTFTGWSGGGCSGTGTCVVNVNTAYTVTATFNPSCNSYTYAGGTILPTPVNPGATLSTTCNYGIAGVDCINSYLNGVKCTFNTAVGSVGWTGTAANFTCTAPSTPGTYTHVCTMDTNTGSNCCSRTNNDGSVTVNPTTAFDFSLSLNPPSDSVVVGNNTQTIITAALVSGTPGLVTFSASDPLDPTITFGWITSSCTPNNSCTILLGVHTTSATTLGLHQIVITGTGPGGAPRHTINFNLTVIPPVCTVDFDHSSYNVGQNMNITFSHAPTGSTLKLTDSSGADVYPFPLTVSGGETRFIVVRPPAGTWKVELINSGAGCYAIDTATVSIPPCQVQFDLGVYNPLATMHIDYIDAPAGSTLTLFKPSGAPAQTAPASGTGFLNYNLVAGDPAGTWKVTLIGGSGSCDVKAFAEVKPPGCSVSFANDTPAYVFGSTVIINYTDAPLNTKLGIYDPNPSGNPNPPARQNWTISGSGNVTWAGTIDLVGKWKVFLEGVSCLAWDETVVAAAPTCASVHGGSCEPTQMCHPEGTCVCGGCLDCHAPAACCCVTIPCAPDGCNGNCPINCTVAQDPDCGCKSGNGCCGKGCNSSNDGDCPTCNVTFGQANYILGNTITINYSDAPANTSLSLTDPNAPSNPLGAPYNRKNWVVEGSGSKTFLLGTYDPVGKWMAYLQGTNCIDWAETNVSSSCLPNGCNGDCPVGCKGNPADPDCVCQSGNSCCGAGCKNSNDSDCPTILGGLVPCGRAVDNPTTAWDDTAPCTLCHLFVMFKRIVDFATIDILFPIAVLMLVVGGVLFLTAGGDPGKVNQGKTILKATVIGIVIVMAAWLVVNTIIMLITPATSPFRAWNTINCALCGDGTCNQGETTATCPVDCP